MSILYRTHKSLSAQAKVSSLYVFDALARDAKAQANKQKLVSDVSALKGNCATFLLKVEGVLEGLFQDMVLVGTPEAKVSFSQIRRSYRYQGLPTKRISSSQCRIARLRFCSSGYSYPNCRIDTPLAITSDL